MKRLISMFIIIVLLFSLGACAVPNNREAAAPTEVALTEAATQAPVTEVPTEEPTEAPTTESTAEPTQTPSPTPTPTPAPTPTPKPTNTPKPTATPTPKPTATPKPTQDPSKKAAKIDKLISDIGTVDLFSESKIKKAREAYDSASSAVKKAVKKYDTLVNAEKKFKSIVKEKGSQALKSSRKEHDKVEGITWYESKETPKYINSRCYALPYIGLKDSSKKKPWIVMRWNYTGDDWIFFKKITVKTDKKKYTMKYDYFDVVRDNDYGDVWEYMDDTSISQSDIKMLYDMAKSKQTIVRFEGDHYYHDITLSSKDKQGIMSTLYLYYYLKKYGPN